MLPRGRGSRRRDRKPALKRSSFVTYIYLLIAILCEIVGTTALKTTDGFTRLAPSLVTIIAYALAFYFLSLPLRSLPVGIVYAIWSGTGIVLLALIDLFWFRSSIDFAGFAGLSLILAGVLVINLFSQTVGH
ncbi:putative mebrane transport protein [Fulvimarina pelagi HTCC2506]|uniref:Putative mebrane transport protein n=1 Tax=Fulvimarina pelagi HTCC2506 TaxID=314231 RepID=Q0G5Z9_9HYPH|nr:putative mebrane transport protein [Fulvimarina pelagi HTCC2506]